MASVRARFVASLALAVSAVLVPLVAVPAAASSAPTTGYVGASVARPTTATTATAAATSTAPATLTATFLADGRVIASRSALRNLTFRGRLLMSIAARYRGILYRAGGTSPSTGFDCSGYTRYVFSRLGISIPRVSRDQYSSMQHISRSKAVPGDLVFFHSSSGRVYHAAIYAGGNTVWHSPHTGTRVARERIWTSAVYFARVRI